MITEEQQKKIDYINSHFGEYVIYKSIGETFEAKIGSEVHPINLVVGLDMEDSCPITLLAHIDSIVTEYTPIGKKARFYSKSVKNGL